MPLPLFPKVDSFWVSLYTRTMIQQPYIEVAVISIERKYNPEYGDDRMCQCGHLYYRHFDTYEEMSDVGCKYCGCYTFEEAGPFSPIPYNYFDGSDRI